MKRGGNIRMRYFVPVFLALGIAMVAEPQSPPAKAAHPPAVQNRYPRYILRPGDSFDLSFEFSPEFNQVLNVQPDGFVSLREVGDVYVSGLTLPQVQAVVESKYASFLRQPKISVTPRDLEKSYFIAAGEVSKPGKYELRSEVTVTEGIAIAGGLSPDRARHSQVVLFRREGDHLGRGKVVNVKKMLRAMDLQEDVYLHPGDLLYVPQSTWSKARQVIPIPGVGMQIIPGSTF